MKQENCCYLLKNQGLVSIGCCLRQLWCFFPGSLHTVSLLIRTKSNYLNWVNTNTYLFWEEINHSKLPIYCITTLSWWYGQVLTHRLGSASMLSLIHSEILKKFRQWGLITFDVEIFYPHDSYGYPRAYLKQKSKDSDQLRIMTSQALLVTVNFRHGF